MLNKKLGPAPGGRLEVMGSLLRFPGGIFG